MIGALDALAMPWVFTQSDPLGTAQLRDSLGKRGLPLGPEGLQNLYRRSGLIPLAMVTDDPLRPPRHLSPTDPVPMGTRQAELRDAVADGRLRDLALSPYDEQIRFDARRIGDPKGWWNGLLYSRWQMLALPELRRMLSHDDQLPPVFVRRLAEWVPALVVLESRYLPTIETDWLSVSGAEIEEWEQFRATYDPVGAMHALDVDPAECVAFAEQLLIRAKKFDPTGRWSQLIQRAPRRSWETLSGDALVAMDHRVAAELLLRFYEDLLVQSPTPGAESLQPLATADDTFWKPLAERLSFRPEQHLDRVLSSLGVSPHPGVVVVVEGETEYEMLLRVFDHLGWARTPDQVRIICMRGADKDLAVLGAAIAAPLVGSVRGRDYELIRPPTRLLIVVDQDQRWDSQEKVERNRRKVVDEICRVVKAQGVDVDRRDLDGLVAVEQWSSRCFEFAHFTDEELAAALLAEPGLPSGIGRSELVARISEVRAMKMDIKAAWDRHWRPKPAKPKLADRLWPLLREKIDTACLNDDLEMPPIAQAARRARLLAQRPPMGTWSLAAASSDTVVE